MQVIFVQDCTLSLLCAYNNISGLCVILSWQVCCKHQINLCCCQYEVVHPSVV